MAFILFAAGLFLLLREAIPWIRAKSSGVIYTRGHRRQKVLRFDEPERFVALTRARFNAMGLGALVLVAALGLAFWGVLGAALRLI